MLLSIEWLKLRSYRTFWIILGLFAVLTPLAYYVAINVVKLDGPGPAGNLLQLGNSFATIWNSAAFITSHFVVILGLLMIVLTGNEYQYRTNRQHVIDGWSRLNFYYAKWQMILAGGLATVAFCFAYTVLAAALQGAAFSGFADGIIKLLWLLLLTVNYLAAALITTVLIRRTGLAVIVYVAYYMAIDNLAHMFLVYKYKLAAADLFLPMESSDQLLPKLFSMDLREMSNLPKLPDYAYAAASLGWIVLFYFIGRRKLLRSDW